MEALRGAAPAAVLGGSTLGSGWHMLQCPSAVTLTEDQQQHIGDVAWFVLQQFMYMVRFVDDITSGPNRLLASLLYTSNSVLGGLVQGIHQTKCSLDATPADPCNFPTLDVRVCSWARPDRAGLRHGGIVRSVVRLYDKRMEPCYSQIPIVRYTLSDM